MKYSEETGLNGRILLNTISETWLCEAVELLQVAEDRVKGQVAVSSHHGERTFGFRKGIDIQAETLSGPEEGLCSTKLLYLTILTRSRNCGDVRNCRGILSGSTHAFPLAYL
jgi:hypothetical protein